MYDNGVLLTYYIVMKKLNQKMSPMEIIKFIYSMSSHITKLKQNNHNNQHNKDRWKPKPCPIDFPEKLKQYWSSGLQYSLTPIQSGWMFYYDAQEKKRKFAKKKCNRRNYPILNVK